ncbi:MAG: arginyl-tRNA synthetase [Candidatus Bathyarchaeota archaeon B23]|nr:MAG: arginyl-tRNA synthetase [Candidatus Bathyarchaeota archaeon B23]
MSNPLDALREECLRLLDEGLEGLSLELESLEPALSRPPNPAMGDLSTSLCFKLASRLGRSPQGLAEELKGVMDPSSSRLVASVEAVGGYINFHADPGEFSKLTLETAVGEEGDYGLLKAERPERVMVEHTSANPNGPIHVGNARNSILGDALAKMLRYRGHRVVVHFYVDDMGRQVAMATYGWRLLGRPEPEGPSDLWVGTIYASVNIIKEVKRLKRELEEAKALEAYARVREINAELSRYAAAAQELRDRAPGVFDALLEALEGVEDPDGEISRLNAEYERGEAEAKRDVRRLVEYCLSGFREALGEIGVHFDSWDYESDLVWSGAVEEVIGRLRRTPYTRLEGGALILDCEAVAQDLKLKERWGINPRYEIPDLVLVRADGTTLYTTRDIAYSLWKFDHVDRVINVIGYEQSTAQLQLRVALAALGLVEIADRQRHYAYKFVTLPGLKMSGRLGRYVTLREVVERAVELAHKEVEARSPGLSEGEKRRIAEMVGHGAVKYALLSVDPMKTVVFDWDRVLDFERNSAPFIQYSHARACSILRKAENPPQPDYGLLRDGKERELVHLVASFPDVFQEAVEALSPQAIASYANTLADRFNSFYASHPVLKAEPKGLAGARLILVDAVRIALRNSLSALGIEAPERM